jgi:hypothetical protein
MTQQTTDVSVTKRNWLLALTGTAIGAVLSAAATGAAKAAGTFSGLATLVSSNGSTSSAPNANLTGNEIIPADTQNQQGINPATIAMTLQQLGAGYVVVTPSANVPGNTPIPANVTNYIIAATAAVTYTALVLPAAALDGAQIIISNASTFAVTLTSVTASGGLAGGAAANGPMVLPAQTTTAPSTGIAYVWSANKGGWYRLR